MTETEKRYAQIEKEAVAVTWACDWFSKYILGCQFQIETDCKALVSPLSTEQLDNLPPHILWFRFRLARFDYTIQHLPGKLNSTSSRKGKLTWAAGESWYLHRGTRYLTSECELIGHFLKQQTLYVLKSRSILAGQRSRLNLSLCPTGRPGVPPHFGAICCCTTANLSFLLLSEKIPQRRFMQGTKGLNAVVCDSNLAIWWPSVTKHMTEMVRVC